MRNPGALALKSQRAAKQEQVPHSISCCGLPLQVAISDQDSSSGIGSILPSQRPSVKQENGFVTCLQGQFMNLEKGARTSVRSNVRDQTGSAEPLFGHCCGLKSALRV